MLHCPVGEEGEGFGGIVGDCFPVDEEFGRAVVEEHEPGDVQRQPVAVEDAVVQGEGELVRREDVGAHVADVRRSGQRVEDPQYPGTHLGHRRTT